MKETSVIINKLSFLDDMIIKYDIKGDSITIRQRKQFLHMFASLKDFRIKKKCTYPIEQLVLLIFFAKLNEEGSNCSSIVRYIKFDAERLCNYGLIKKDEDGKYLIPSHDCFRYFLLNFDSNEIKKALINRLRSFLDDIYSLNKNKKGYTLLNIDGQEFRGSGRAETTNNPQGNIATLNIYDASSYVCLYSKPITKKESEIPTARSILTYLNLKNKIITADALHTCNETADLIIKRKGNYCFRVKENRKTLLSIIKKFLEEKKKRIKKEESNDRIFEFINISDLVSDEDFPGLKTCVRVTSKMKHNKGEYLYFVSSLTDNTAIMEAIENRWEIENGLHKGKDYYLDEDKFRIADKTAVANFAVINNVILAFYNIAKTLLQFDTMIDVKKRFKFQPMETMELIVSLISTSQLEKLLIEKMENE